eukprot:2774158-Rhodomonas_salina.1
MGCEVRVDPAHEDIVALGATCRDAAVDSAGGKLQPSQPATRRGSPRCWACLVYTSRGVSGRACRIRRHDE